MNPHDLELSVIPWSAESESAVLGGLLLDNATWDHVGDILEPKHFYDERHGRIFAAIASLALACKPADVATVLDELQKSGKATAVDLGFLHSLTQYVPSMSNLRRYAETVAERALMRGLLEAADEVRTIATEAGLTTADRLDKSVSKLQALQIQRGRQEPQGMDSMAVRFLDRIQALHDGTIPPGIPTGIKQLDRRLGGGLRGGKQVVIAARPSIGKSSVALQILLNVARRGHCAAMLSQEMPVDEVADRAVANIGSILLDQITTGRMSDESWSRVTGAIDDLKALPLFFDDQPALTLQDISAKARALKRKHNLKVLALDYIQLCGSRGDKDKRHHQIEEISRGLKTLAKQLDITIITISQLSRGVETRAGGKPMLSDLKESGAIEEDADVVILLSVNQSEPGQARIIEADVAKNRQGRIGSVALCFEGGYQRWTDSAVELERKRASGRTYTEEV
jgi:replicative DNA helicase